MARVSIGVSAPGAAAEYRETRSPLNPASLRLVLVAAAAASAGLGWFVSGHGSPSGADAELTRVLQFMTLTKGFIGAGALWMVSIRFRYTITRCRAVGYIAGAAIMASGPGAMLTTAHIILGSLLFYAGLGSLLALGWFEGSTNWRFRGRGG